MSWQARPNPVGPRPIPPGGPYYRNVPEHGQSMPRTSTARALCAMHLSPAHQRQRLDGTWTEMNYNTLATSCYTRTLVGWPAMVSSPMCRAAWWRTMVSKVETEKEMRKLSTDGLLSCTRRQRTLGDPSRQGCYRQKLTWSISG
jgi:hypothetical protein